MLRCRLSLPPVPSSRKTAQAGADDHDIVRLGQRNTPQVETRTIAQRVGDLEGAWVTAAQTRLAGRVRTGRRGPRKELRGRRAGDDAQCDAVEKIAAGYPGHGAKCYRGRRRRECCRSRICTIRGESSSLS